MLNEIKQRIKRWCFGDVKFTLKSTSLKLEKLGSEYGGWIIPVDKFNNTSICYLAGAGEDISFDICLANRFKCSVFIFDPTPRAKMHFEKVVLAARDGYPAGYSNDKWYDLKHDTPDFLVFFELGVWTKRDKLKFYAPDNDNHVSHSISNLQHTEKYFEAEVNRLSSIMAINGHTTIDLIKLDIEGAEFDVIDTIIKDKIDVKIICVEFHKTGKDYKVINQTIRNLETYGYNVIAREGLDFTFIKEEYI